jgi:hypothetical protein
MNERLYPLDELIFLMYFYLSSSIAPPMPKVETPIHDNVRGLATWECKEHGVKS